MKVLVLVAGVLLGTAAYAHAGQIVLSWDYPVASQQGTTYTLRIVTLRGSTPTQQERTIAPFTPQQCSLWPNQARTAETLCGQVCLDPGDYTLSLFAARSGARSGESNVLDIDLTSTTPCPPTTVVQSPPKPPPKSSPAKASTGATGVVVAGGASAAGGQGETPSWTSMVNLACVSWAITGPCYCNPYTPCVSVTYWEPGWLVETVKRPGTTSLDLLAPLLHAALDVLGVPAVGGGGAGNASGSGHTNLHYNEVHVYTFPQLLGGPCTSCAPSTAPFTLHYASEADAPAWRTAVATPSPLSLLHQIGVWAPLYPRGGKAIHSSEPVASGIAATRAMDITHQPIGTPPNADAHVVLQPTDGTSTCCQLASPKQTPCFPAGTPPVIWEHGTGSPRGTYLWLFWRKRTCCVNPNQATCGITLAGGHGANGCLLPSRALP